MAIFAALVITAAPCFGLQDDADDGNLNLESFNQVYETIKRTHWDQEMVGEQWDNAREKWLPKVEAATTIDEARDAMNGMIEELGQSHFGVIPSTSYDAMQGDDDDDDAASDDDPDTDNEETGDDDDAEDDDDDEDTGSGYANSGLTFRAVNETQIAVIAVREGSSAEQLGVKPGWLLIRNRKKSAEKFVESMKEAAHGPMRYETLVGLVLGDLLTGEEGASRKLTFQKPDGEEVELDIEYSLPPGRLAKFGNIPEMWVSSRARTFDGEIGYYWFSAFFDPPRIMTEYRQTLNDAGHRNGLIIDVRGNYGGIGAMTMGMAGAVADEEAFLGTMTSRSGELRFAINPSGGSIDCPVAVLIDECSISSAEILSGGMKDLGLAKVFGARSAGLALPSQVVKLPNGDGFQFAIANYHSASGEALELNGVIPDVEIELTVENLTGSENGDPVLDAALEWIRSGGDK